MDSEILGLCAKEFAGETIMLRRSKETLIVFPGEIGAYIKYAAFKTLKEAGIVVIALPVRTSNVSQPLDISVFAATEEKYRHMLSERAMSTRRN